MHAMNEKTIEYLGLPEAELTAAGSVWTAREIEQQPRMLKQTHALVAGLHAQIRAFAGPVIDNPAARVILTGAGSSSYVGQCIAALLDRHLAARVDAVPTTDIVSAPRLHLEPSQPLLLVSFGRSGNSPESLAAVELAESLVDDVRHLAIVCNADGALGKLAVARSMTVLLPAETHDTGFAMTSSFSCMIYAVVAALLPAATMDGRIDAIANATARVIHESLPMLRELAGGRYERVAWLGSGVLQGLAREAALKLGELTNGAVATCFESSLGFRHGPKTFVNGRTLVMAFVSNDRLTRRYDLDLVDELRRDGCAARVVEVTAQPRTNAGTDHLAVPAMAGADDLDLLWPYVAVAQIFAFLMARNLQVTVDNPNPAGVVNRVVQGVHLYPLDP
jgi:tagatose-6-phosphate ketose/aldose isomerase